MIFTYVFLLIIIHIISKNGTFPSRKKPTNGTHCLLQNIFIKIRQPSWRRLYLVTSLENFHNLLLKMIWRICHVVFKALDGSLILEANKCKLPHMSFWTIKLKSVPFSNFNQGILRVWSYICTCTTVPSRISCLTKLVVY